MASDDIPAPLSLLLLPAPPSPPTSSALEAAYSQSLAYVLRSVANLPNASQKASILDIALPRVISSTQDRSVRSGIFDQVQKLLARLYRLISIVCVQKNIEVEGRGGVNVRVFILEYVPDLQFDGEDQDPSLKSSPTGPLIDLPTLAQCGRPWTRVYSFGCEGGEALLRAFKDLRARLLPKAESLDTVIVLGRTVMDDTSSNSGIPVAHAENPSDRKHEWVAVGGTFDHLHAGHKLLLTMTAFLLQSPSHRSHGRKLGRSYDRIMTVGITGDELLRNKKFADFMQSWRERFREVLEFLVGILDFSPAGQGKMMQTLVARNTFNILLLDAHVEVKCVEISDHFGPTITDESISALVISAETRSGGAAVNEKRREKGWVELEVFEVDVLDAGEEGDDESGAVKEDFASKISSTEIRRLKSDMARSGDEGYSKRSRTREQE